MKPSVGFDYLQGNKNSVRVPNPTRERGGITAAILADDSGFPALHRVSLIALTAAGYDSG